jgi:asparagine synthase (glutamine-hydrolysing)
VSHSEFQADLPSILAAMDQPTIDGVNAWFVSKAAKEAGLKVAISGVGGDELLAGYPGFREIPQWVHWLRVPAAVPGLGFSARLLGSALGLARRAPKALGMIEYGGDYAGAYLLRRGLFLPFELKTVLDPDVVRVGLRRLKPLSRLRAVALTPEPTVGASRVAALESTGYMRNQLLRDSDWAGMAHSVEIRTPLVDFDLLKALAPVIPLLINGLGKAALAAAPAPPLPSAVLNRPKTGFGVPTSRWIAACRRTGTGKGAASRAWGLDVYGKIVGNTPLAAGAV